MNIEGFVEKDFRRCTLVNQSTLVNNSSISLCERRLELFAHLTLPSECSVTKMGFEKLKQY